MIEIYERQQRMCNMMIFDMPEKGTEKLDKKETKAFIKQISKDVIDCCELFSNGKKE